MSAVTAANLDPDWCYSQIIFPTPGRYSVLFTDNAPYHAHNVRFSAHLRPTSCGSAIGAAERRVLLDAATKYAP